MPVSVVILAAGQGKRMHSDLPKVLQPLAGRPLLAHVLAAARALEPAAIHVVYGHGGDAVKAAFAAQPDLELGAAIPAARHGPRGAPGVAVDPRRPSGRRCVRRRAARRATRTLQRLVKDSADGDLALSTAVRRRPDAATAA